MSQAPTRPSSSGLAKVYNVENSASGIKQIEFHPGRGSAHNSGDRYYRITYADREVRVINPDAGFKPGTITNRQIYLDKDGRVLRYEAGRWKHD